MRAVFIAPFIALLLAACSGSGSPPVDTDEPADSEPADTEDSEVEDSEVPDTDPPGDTEDPPETDPPVDTDPPAVDPCRLSSATATPVVPRNLLPRGVGYVDAFGLYNGSTTARAIQDHADYDRLAATLGQRLPAVDFATETVIFGWRGVTSTCGLTVERWAVLEIPGTSDVVFQLGIRDSSGGCGVACDMIQMVARLVAVPRSVNPALCVRDFDACP